MKKLNKLFAMLIAVLGVTTSAKADTSILSESEGWQKITEMPTNIEDYYYALVDNTQDLMLTMAVGAHQGSGYYTMYYKASQNPLQNKAALWTIEGTNYTFRNAEYTKWAMQTEWGAAWHYRTHDQANACEWTATVPAYSLTDLCWTIQNGKYPDSGYLGPWDNTVVDGAEVACNKTSNAIGKFQIYAIHKTYCVDVLAANATPTNPVDMTVLLANANADLPVVGMGGWTTANTIARNVNNGYDGKGGFFEFCNWGSTTGWKGSISQSLSNLPNGKYIVKAAAQAQVDVVLTLTANGMSVNLNSKGDTGGSLGYQGWEYIQVECMVTDGTLDISVFSEATTNAKWGNVDNFTLTYLGPDKTASENIFNERYNTIKNYDTTQPISATFVAEINDLISKYKNTSATSLTQAQLDDANNEMLELINRYQPNVDAYIRLKKYIDMTEDFADVSSYREKYNNKKYTIADIEPTRQELNVLRFTQASAIYTNKVDVKNWNGSMVTRNEQHWSGSTKSYYDANSWSDTNNDALTTSIDLVAGNYVLKVAGRSHLNALLKLEVLEKSIEFHAKGDTGYGITKHGTASFSPDSAYANGNNGFGWEWEFLKFTLSEAQTVTLSVSSYYNNNWQVWNSFGDITLWMDDATYVTVNGDAIDAPLAEAKALVENIIMGDDEKSALRSAITLCDTKATTPDELNAQIEALETAVANANSFIANYNEAKKASKLVDAFERFEANYNDGANGALRPMSTEAWNTLLEAVKKAAETKDVTNSYDGFASAAEALNAAMDAAELSIAIYAKYAGLITAIRNYNATVNDANLTAALNAADTDDNKTSDTKVAAATTTLNEAFVTYKNSYDGDIDASTFLGENLDFESGTGSSLDKLVYNIPGWELEYDGDANANVRIQPEVQGESNAIRIRSNWENAATTMRIYKEVTLPAGSYTLSLDLLTSISGKGINLTYTELDGEQRTVLTSGTYKTNTYSLELNEPKILHISLGLTGTTGNDPQELYADNISLTLHNKTAFQRALETLQAVEGTSLVKTNVLTIYGTDGKEATLTEDEKVLATAIMNNATTIANNNGAATSLIKNADFTGGTDSHSADGGGIVQSPKQWNFSYTYSGWNDTQVMDDNGIKFFNAWCGAMTSTGAYAELSQTISSLPNGTYKLSADVATSVNSDAGSWVAIYAAPHNATGGLNYGAIARSKNATQGDDESSFTNYEVYFKVEYNAAVIGIRTDKNFFKIKNIKLEYVAENDTEVDNGILLQGAFTNRRATSWDITSTATNASGTEIYLDNPNAIVYAANDGQVNWNNTVVDGTAASIVLTEGYAFNIDTDFTAETLNYNREFIKDTWLTVCLPFTYAIPENVKVETLSEIDTDTKTFTFDEVTGTMEANKPYIVKNSTEAAALFASLSNTAVAATPETMNVTVNGSEGEFIGTYTTMSSTVLMEDGTYDILFFGTDGQLYYLSQGVTTKVITFKPFRAYVRLPKGAINWSDGQQARVRHRAFGEETDIENTESTFLDSEIIYDLMGRKVTTMEKGKMYIVNGKKVIR